MMQSHYGQKQAGTISQETIGRKIYEQALILKEKSEVKC